MATACTLPQLSFRRGMLLTLGAALVPLSGCATGSSASFTQAPLLFSEQTEANETTSDNAAPDQVALESDPQVPTTSLQVGSAGSGGVPSLPTAAIASVTRPLGGAIAQLTAVLPVSAKVGPGAAAVAVGSPASVADVQASLSGGTIAAAVQTGIVPPVEVQVDLPSVTGATTATVTLVATNLPVVSTVLQSPPMAGGGNAVGGIVAAVGSTAAAQLQPVTATTGPITSIASKPPAIPVPTAAGVAQSAAVTASSLLTTTSAKLARICVLKGCR